MVRRRLAGALLLAILAGCTAIPTQVPRTISGHVQFLRPKFKAAYTSSDMAAGAAVTLLQDNTTIAAGITDANGDFQFTAPGTVDPAVVYKLTATKRFEDNGQHVSLTTYVQENPDGSWRSITQGLPVINAATTAVTMVAKYQNLLPATTLDGVTASEVGANPEVINVPSLNLTLAEDVAATVDFLINQKIDPLRGVSYVENAYSYGSVAVRAATAGVSLMRIIGFGFDPIPARNRVAFSVNGETVWAQALNGSNENNLLVRVPPLPAPANGKGYQDVTFEVWNGANAVSLQQPDLDFLVYSPWRVPDQAIQLPTDLTTPLGLTRHISVAAPSVTTDNRLHLVWLDQRFAAPDYTPIYQAWDRSTDTLGAANPRVSDGTVVTQVDDPAHTPFIFLDESNPDPLQHKTHVLWQGVSAASGEPAIYHRIAVNGSWLPKVSGDPLGLVSSTGQLAGAPSFAQIGNRLMCAYLAEHATSGQFNVFTRLWDGYISSTNAPAWADSTHTKQDLIMINGGTRTASAPQIAVAITSPTDITYHVVWLDYDPADPAGTQIMYRQGVPTGTNAITTTWDPPITGPNPVPQVFETNPGAIQGLTSAADANKNFIVVWISGTTPMAKFIPFGIGVPMNNIPLVTADALQPLPGNLAETNPQLVAIGAENFYLVTASKAINPSLPGQGGEIWLRRWVSGTWSRAVNLSNSPGVLSENPSLHWNGRNLTATWIEGRSPVVLPIIPDI